MAEFLLYGRTEYEEVIGFAESLGQTARRIGSVRAEAFAVTVAGEAKLLSGRLHEARVDLDEGVRLHRSIGATSGESLSLQRLAELHLYEGDRVGAARLADQSLPLARWSPIAKHLIQRVQGTRIRAATDPLIARALVDEAWASLGLSDGCGFCAVMLAVPSAIACAAVGDIEAASGYVQIAEGSASLWQGTAWRGAVVEAKAHVARASGDDATAMQQFADASYLFTLAGQPFDTERCRVAFSSR